MIDVSQYMPAAHGSGQDGGYVTLIMCPRIRRIPLNCLGIQYRIKKVDKLQQKYKGRRTGASKYKMHERRIALWH